ncbi:olfactory receptor 6N2-like [Perca fluviatilis]|uniref:olfactory receptor 6N2-like n=1 Tax=Perca fluviatilis TaxID=8168 RepID=UPI001966AC73|nr:olfactory receptor 6N2-like [Perca fluviatilis]
MDDEFNVTYITLGGYAEMGKSRYFYFVIMFTVYIVAILFSVTIVCLICMHRNLHEPMYIFIAALLMNSIVYNTAMYPNLLVNFFTEKQIISYSACLLQLFLYYFLSASDFLLLSAMAYDRYVSICKPLQYPNIMRKTTVSIILGVAWFVPAFQLAVSIILSSNMKLCHFTLNAIFCNNSVYSLQCVASEIRAIFDLFALLSLALLPLLFILFTYTRILIITYRSGREVRKKAAQTCLPHLIVLLIFSFLCAYDVIVIQLDVGSEVHLIMTLQAFLYYPLFYPIIYGLQMKEISKHIKRLFCQAKVI